MLMSIGPPYPGLLIVFAFALPPFLASFDGAAENIIGPKWLLRRPLRRSSSLITFVTSWTSSSLMKEVMACF